MNGDNRNTRKMKQSDVKLLTPIGSRERALAILASYPAKQYLYVIIKCRLIDTLKPDLVGAIFPAYAELIQWHDIFTLARGVKSVSGIVAIVKDKRRPMIPQSKKNDQSAVRYFDESIVFSYSIVDEPTFRGSVMNYKSTMEYSQDDVATKRKLSLGIEAPTQPKSIPSSKPTKPEVRKPLDNIKPTQAKPAGIPVSVNKEAPAVKNDVAKTNNDQNKPKANFDMRQSEFVPITSESLGHVENLMKQYEREDRLVAIVFDRCFNQPDITMGEIRKRFEPIFGDIGDDCVLIKSSLYELLPNLDEAYKRPIILKGQAYFIGPKSLSRKEFASVASQSSILSGLMTIGCVMLNLKRGAYLINKKALSKVGSPETTVISNPIEQQSKGKRIKLECDGDDQIASFYQEIY